jgi:hypothetical protein
VTFQVIGVLFRRMKVRHAAWPLGFALVAILGYWFARWTITPPQHEKTQTTEAGQGSGARRTMDDEPVRFRRENRPPVRNGDAAAKAAGALEGQRILMFADAGAMARFLARMGDGVRLLGRLDALNALRVGFDDHGHLAGLLEETEEGFIYPVFVPTPPQGTVQAGAVALGDGLHEWLGITGDNSTWGKGVTVAVLDTGVESHAAFSSNIRALDLSGNGVADPNGHGTAVASVIIGGDPLTPGVAPGADLLAVSVADANGNSDSFLLAKGIIAAADAGADLINISMSSFGDSGLIRRAIAYARDSGALIIAAAGNNGIEGVSYPAANEGVIAVGAVDALGNHLDFSNRGDELSVSAPGYGLNTAWTNGQSASMSGTSFSAPVVTGAIAAIMTAYGKGKLSASQAWEKLSSHLNDAGEAGKDSSHGAGMPDIGRVLNSKTRGIYDAAVASNRIIPPDSGIPYGAVEVLVQNRGTETLINTTVDVTVAGKKVSSNITSLPPNAVRTVRVPVANPPSPNANTLRVDSRVTLTTGGADAKPSNNRRAETYVAAGSR